MEQSLSSAQSITDSKYVLKGMKAYSMIDSLISG